MKLPNLLSVLPEYRGLAPEVEVTSLANDARRVESGAIFVAITGSKIDAHEFIPQAIMKGAIALVVEKLDQIPKDYSGYVMQVESTRNALQKLAAKWFDFPSKKATVIGVTGTNGKTSTVYLLEHVLNELGKDCGVLGTIDHHLRDVTWESQLTTPDPLILQERIAGMVARGAKAIAMEVSSHALDQGRADSVDFDITIFTNLTRDHLDYHKTLENYFISKQKLFTKVMRESAKGLKFAVINVGDFFGARLKVDSSVNILTFGKHSRADFQYKILKMDFSGTSFSIFTPRGSLDVWIPLIGDHNVKNCLGVAISIISMGFQLEKSFQVLASFKGVPGRLQRVENLKDLHVFIDYAHSPDALDNVLQTLKEIKSDLKSKSKIITVFGCGGDRDKGKRPIMANVAEKYSDIIVITSDNPRGESPDQIINDIESGLKKFKKVESIAAKNQSSVYFVESDRRRAIELAFKAANPNDVVLVAGKGHECFQIIGDQKFEFNDFQISRELLQ